MTRRLVRRLRRARLRFFEDPMVRVMLRGRLLHPYWRRRFHSFGARSVVHKPDFVRGAHKIAVGEDVLIMGGWLSVERGAWHRPGPALRIGDRVGIRPNCTIVAAESVIIEDDVAISSHSSVLDFRHKVDGPFDQIALNPLLPLPTRIGRGTAIGERVAVLRGSTIGEHCIIGANSVVRGEIPDYSVAVGSPARVVGTTREAVEARRAAAAEPPDKPLTPT